MTTFVDVTDSVNVERALKDRERGAGARRPAQERFRPARLLRTALAADQHHRLHRAAGARRYRAAQRTPARICRPYRLVLGGAADHRQRHPRPRDGRCGHHGARYRRDRHRRGGAVGVRPRCRTAARAQHQARGRPVAGARHASMPTGIGCARSSTISSTTRPTTRRKASTVRLDVTRIARRAGRVPRQRRRAGHVRGGARNDLPALRVAREWRPQARRGARPLDRQELRRTALAERSRSHRPRIRARR